METKRWMGAVEEYENHEFFNRHSVSDLQEEKSWIFVYNKVNILSLLKCAFKNI